MSSRLTIYIVSLIALMWWLVIGMCMPASTAWRDSPEFILGALYLDITHPPGFPLYSQLANTFTLIPFGPIAWRVNIFSALASLWAAASLFYLGLKLSKRAFSCSELAATWIAGLACLPFLLWEPTIRQSISAEVYSLNAALLFTLLILLERYDHNRDVRFLIIACFVAGLGMGNHVSLGLACLLICAILCLPGYRASFRKAFLPGIIFGLFGVAIYSYLPVRSGQELPLNTGQPNSYSRLVQQITNARNADLRSGFKNFLETSNKENSGSGDLFEESVGASSLRFFFSDFKRLAASFDVVPVILGILGLVCLYQVSKFLSLALLAVAMSNWWFFRGWDFDPWLPLFGVFCLGSCALGSFLWIRRVNIASKVSLCLGGVILALSVAGMSANLINLNRYSNFENAASASIRELGALPRHVPYLSENSWFLNRYVQLVEGFRDDLTLIYQPSVLFPDYFAVQKFRSPTGAEFDSGKVSAVGVSTNQTEGLQRLSDFIGQVTPTNALYLAPNVGINAYLKGVIRCSESGVCSLEWRKPGKLEPGYLAGVSSNLIQIPDRNSIFASDARSYFEQSLLQYLDLLESVQGPESAIQLVEGLCPGVGKGPCTLISLNSLAVLKLKAGRVGPALKLLLDLSDTYPDYERASIRANFKVGLSRADKELRRETLLDPRAISLLAPKGH